MYLWALSRQRAQELIYKGPVSKDIALDLYPNGYLFVCIYNSVCGCVCEHNFINENGEIRNKTVLSFKINIDIDDSCWDEGLKHPRQSGDATPRPQTARFTLTLRTGNATSETSSTKQRIHRCYSQNRHRLLKDRHLSVVLLRVQILEGW